MKAITTKYLPATDTKGARVTANDGDGNRVLVAWETSSDADGCHAEAAKALCHKLGWQGRLQGGDQLKAGVTVARVWCWIDKRNQIKV